MAFGSAEPRIRPSRQAALCAARALRRRERSTEQAGGPEIMRLARAIANREPVSAPKLLGLFDRQRADRHAAHSAGSNTAKSLALYALLGGSSMHRQVYRAVELHRGAQQPEGS